MWCLSSCRATCASRGSMWSPSILRRHPGEAGLTQLAPQVEGPALVRGDFLFGAAQNVHLVVDDRRRVAVARGGSWRLGFGGQVPVPGGVSPGLQVEYVQGLPVRVVVAREVASKKVEVVAVEARAVAPAFRGLVGRSLTSFYLLLVHFPNHLILVRRWKCCFRFFQFHNNYKLYLTLLDIARSGHFCSLGPVRRQSLPAAEPPAVRTENFFKKNKLSSDLRAGPRVARLMREAILGYDCHSFSRFCTAIHFHK